MAGLTNKDADDVRFDMPIQQVYGYEHVFFAKEGYVCSVIAPSEADLAIAALLRPV